ncbi:1-deoxy-D-xylulose-5-phosphate reductoisomerase [Hymenobacter taeanensis]|uniref:1-deoxy-D-xylulose 5-phosphate reductoisomerase n=1 Tax=Hymenobacter taeanensis TaxID=2735321 RepID=A0A6M6BCS9_9BACT|nr:MULTISPECIES: 1-deoxy-D-xylulose-5-phosphate reductoisomerase [Hymenobacter]QJX45809.1 1-deoxy-D-xylulose-5-phosphate reductoisomerase [Hymenobacter taeanensis]UOQ79653.1 1-deoxy-D-xylulose-5-phosphate reductoisomerase [Hymenobacter sp. 5414T-23]
MPDSFPKRVTLLGSTGSIGTQALDVIRSQPGKFTVTALSAHSNAELLIQQAQEFRPAAVVIGDEAKYKTVKAALASQPETEVLAGSAALADVAGRDDVDVVLTAMVGYAGLLPTVRAIRAGKTIALANKETLVVAGQLITELVKEYGVGLYPVDSEHSAIFQCLVGEEQNLIEKIILTASGGPFRGRSREQLAQVTKAQALKHPNWDMGAKITIDSASLMNKGLEVIEAKWLFGLRNEQIDVVVHPQSIIHSLVQFEDGSLKAQLGLPDMKLPIQYALGYPQRLPNTFPRFSFLDYPQLTFEQADTTAFRNLALAFEAMGRAGNAPCVLNAANEIAVAAFLRDEIGFLQMSDVVETSLARVSYLAAPSLDDYVQTDHETRRIAQELVGQV